MSTEMRRCFALSASKWCPDCWSGGMGRQLLKSCNRKNPVGAQGVGVKGWVYAETLDRFVIFFFFLFQCVL
jgi:hypothetical protein